MGILFLINIAITKNYSRIYMLLSVYSLIAVAALVIPTLDGYCNGRVKLVPCEDLNRFGFGNKLLLAIQTPLSEYSGLADDYEPEPIQGANYIPSMGQESMVHTLGERRLLLTNELEVAMEAFPGLRQSCLDGVWPRQNMEKAQAVARRVDGHETLTTHEIELRMEVFRKVILGVEKYRICNPARISAKYVDFISSCLTKAPEGAWGSAAYLLEYAGLVFKDHIVDLATETSAATEAATEARGKVVPELNLSSLWQQAAIRLLDLEFAHAAESAVSETTTDHSARMSTSDQRHFQQVPLGLDGEASVCDMLLGVMRVALRVQLMGREGVSICRVKMQAGSEAGGVLPAYSSVKLCLGLDPEFSLIEEVEMEAEVEQSGFGGRSRLDMEGPGQGEDTDKDDEDYENEDDIQDSEGGPWIQFVVARRHLVQQSK